MWIFTNRGYLSVVQDRNDPNRLLVRARQEEFLRELFGDRVFEDENADYPFRAWASRVEVTDVLYSEVLAIDYGNFKESVKEPKYKAALGSCWEALAPLGCGWFKNRRKTTPEEFEDMDPSELNEDEGSLTNDDFEELIKHD